MIPRPGQAERLVPRRELHGAGTSIARERHAEHLQHNARHVVLRLRLREAERVHLQAVAEARVLRVGHAVALYTDALPHLREGAHLAHLFDEADASVDEERDATDRFGELRIAHLTRCPNGIEDVDCRGQCVGQLLGRSGPCLLQVVAAHVDRIPLRHVMDGVGHHVDDQPSRRLGRVDVGSPRKVLLHDVVLGGAGENRRVDATLVGEGHVETEQPRRRGVDGHRRVHLLEGDVGEQLAHVAEMHHRNTDLADLAIGR